METKIESDAEFDEEEKVKNVLRDTILGFADDDKISESELEKIVDATYEKLLEVID